MAMGARMSVVAENDDVLEAAPAAPKRAPAKPTPATNRAAFTADALSALINLGYQPGDAAQAVAQIAADHPEAETATLIRLALKLLAPRN